MDPETMAIIQQLMKQRDQQSSQSEELAMLKALGPQGLQQQTGLGTMDERGQLIAGNRDEKKYNTAAGTILSSLGNAVGGARQQMLLDHKDQGRNQFAQARGTALGSLMGDQPAPDIQSIIDALSGPKKAMAGLGSGGGGPSFGIGQLMGPSF